MAICDYCNMEMTTGRGCTDAPIVIDGQPYAPIRHGCETGYSWPPDLPRCHDCWVASGDVHHHGCDMEECPACGEQSIACDCRWAGEEDDDEVWAEDVPHWSDTSGSI